MPKEGLEARVYSATAFCGGVCRTLSYIGTLGTAWVQPNTGHSGPCRSDVVEAYRKGLDVLRNKCRDLFDKKEENLRSVLAGADPKTDVFLVFLDEKRIDGVCSSGEKTDQYWVLREHYDEDRRFFVESCYNEWLKEKLTAKSRFSFLGNKFFLHAATAALVIGALGIPGYIALNNTKKEFHSELNNTKQEFRYMLEPRYIDAKVQEYISSPEGQKTAESIKLELKALLEKEGLSEKKIDEIVDRKILPALAEMKSSDNNRELAKEIVKELFGTVTPEMLDKILKILESREK